MIFVLLTFGGWNEAAYLAGEVRDARRNMIRILVGGILIVTVRLPSRQRRLSRGTRPGRHEGVEGGRRGRHARRRWETRAPLLIALIVCLAALTTMNAAIFTGARTTYALGRDFAFFGKLGAWRETGSTPANALLVQGAITLVLVTRAPADPRRLQRDGGLYLARVLDVLPAHRRSPSSFPGRAISTRRSGCRCTRSFRSLSCSIASTCCTRASTTCASAVEFGVAVFAGLVVMALGIPLYFVARKR